MATQESTRSIGKKPLPTRLIVNTDTGAADLYVDEGVFGRTKVATGSAIGNNWTINSEFVKKYNTRNGTNLNQSQVQGIFNKEYQSTFNNDRANIINNYSPYNTKTYLATQAKVPGIIDPATGLKTGQTAQTKPIKSSPDPAPPGAPAASAGGSTLPTNQGNLSDPNSLPIQIGNMQGIAQQKEYGTLRYPLYAEGEFDYLKVSVLKYTRKGLTQRGDGPSLGNVFLPMQPNISDSNGVSWNEDRMNILQAQFGTAAYNAILKAGQVSSGSQLGQLISSFGSDMLSTIGSIANTPGLDKLIAGYFAGQAVQSNILGRASGAVINNNLELLFDGPKLRTFRYNFRFTPRDESEAMVVKEIIRLFKEEMAPDQTPGLLFLTSPNVFKLEYIYGKTGKQHPYLNVIKPCALTDFSVNYTPDGTYMTYSADEGAGGDGSMTSYTVDMQFSELDPIYKKDQQAAGGTGY